MRLLPLLLLTACASGSAREADLGRDLEGRIAGEPKDCVAASASANLVARDRRTLVYRRGDTIWVNRLDSACPGLGPMSQLILEAHSSRYCRGDPFRARETGLEIPGPICVLGRFTPWRR